MQNGGQIEAQVGVFAIGDQSIEILNRCRWGGARHQRVEFRLALLESGPQVAANRYEILILQPLVGDPVRQKKCVKRDFGGVARISLAGVLYINDAQCTPRLSCRVNSPTTSIWPHLLVICCGLAHDDDVRNEPCDWRHLSDLSGLQTNICHHGVLEGRGLELPLQDDRRQGCYLAKQRRERGLDWFVCASLVRLIDDQTAERLNQLIVALILKIPSCRLEDTDSRTCLQRNRHAMRIKLRVLMQRQIKFAIALGPQEHGQSAFGDSFLCSARHIRSFPDNQAFVESAITLSHAHTLVGPR